MTFTEKARVLEKLAADNSPLILTAIGVTGTVTTALLTGKAAIRADRAISREELRKLGSASTEQLELGDKVKLVWKLYIPAAATGVVTITAIIAANRIGTRRAAALAAAYGISEKAFVEYKDKVVEKLGETKERSVRDEIAQDQVRANPPVESQIIMTGDGMQLFREAYTGRYFHSTMEDVKQAMNATNYKVNNHFYASLTDFYDILGLPPTAESSEVGWNSSKLMEIVFTAVMSDDGNKPCISMDYKVSPIRGYTSSK